MTKIKPSLNDKLKEKLSETGLSVNALEKRAGLKRSAVQNILHGKSKKPSAEILYAISKVLGCSVHDLLAHPTTDTSPPVVHALSEIDLTLKDDIQKEGIQTFDLDLYNNAVNYANSLFKENKIELNATDTLNFIQEIYQYAFNSNRKEIDQTFSRWLLNKLNLQYKKIV
jgi:transcriptional regulator with XRE-family HTH domain